MTTQASYNCTTCNIPFTTYNRLLKHLETKTHAQNHYANQLKEQDEQQAAFEKYQKKHKPTPEEEQQYQARIAAASEYVDNMSLEEMRHTLKQEFIKSEIKRLANDSAIKKAAQKMQTRIIDSESEEESE